MSLARRLLVANPSVQVSSLLRGGFATPSAPLTTDLTHGTYAPSQAGGLRKFIYKIETWSHVSPGFNITSPTANSSNTGDMIWTQGYSNSGTAGYIAGGGGVNGLANATNIIYKLTIPSETGSKLSTTLNNGRWTGTGESESCTAGYVFGGGDTSFGNRYNTVEKMPFSTETNAVMGSSFTKLGNANNACSNGSTTGYTLGGYNDPAGDHTQCNYLTYSTSTFTSNFASLSATARQAGSSSNDGTAGYVYGGYDGVAGNLVTSIKKILYSSNTLSVISATMIVAANNHTTCDYYQIAAYISGAGYGFTHRFPYTTETRSLLHTGISSLGPHAGSHIHNNGVNRG
jgi:hypothetical protein